MENRKEHDIKNKIFQLKANLIHMKEIVITSLDDSRIKELEELEEDINETIKDIESLLFG
jgi:cob(I)alamin adenosyltransferase